MPLRLQATAPTRTFLRDVYFDTPDMALRMRGVTCRVRHRADRPPELTVVVVTEQGGQAVVTRADSDVPSGNAQDALVEETEAAHLLRAIVNPASLGPQLELEIEEYARTAWSRWWRPARFELEYAIATVREAGLSRSFHEIALHTLRRGRPSTGQLARAMSEQLSLRSLTIDRRDRGEQIRAALESEALARRIGGGSWVAVVALDGAQVATLRDGSTWRLPLAEGSGEEACRHLMRSALGSSVGDLKLLTTTLGEGRLRSLEVWICTRVDRSARIIEGPAPTWIPIEELLARIGTPEIKDAGTLAALALLAKSDLLPRLVSLPSAGRIEERAQKRRQTTGESPASPLGDAPLLDADASLLAFNERVLALAEDASVPLLERVRYLAIVASNLDEFFSVRVGGLKFAGRDVEGDSDESRSADARIAPVARQVRALLARQYACAAECLGALATHGIRVRLPGELSDAEREDLRTYFRSTLFPYLTPRAITATPGHSLPIVADRGLCFAVVLREGAPDGPLHLAELAVPPTLPRFVRLGEGGTGTDFVPLEEVIRQALPLMYPGRRVEHAHLFRVTRYADLGVDEERAGNLMQAVEERTQQRRHQPVVRIELEQAMPNAARALLLRELELEPGARPGSLGANDVFDIPGLMDLDALRELADLPRPELSFPPTRPRRALAEDQPLWETLRDRDVLLHHPYDDFATSVVRFFNEAADDPDVAAIKVALYRAGERSPIVDALRRAVAAGKDVTVFVELKARFDEERNVRWTKQLQAAGVHVVSGLPGYKNHSKIALVVRREDAGPHRYAHIGTGNYNAGTARVYTDLGVLTAREQTCDDVSDLFNTLTGSSVPADVAYRECLVAPNALLPGLLARINR
ncbi:MAG: polyphosphate kinase 1, partial [Gemmatimonadaceae bacterium]